MSEGSFNIIQTEKGVPIKAWTKGVAIEAVAEKQLRNVARVLLSGSFWAGTRFALQIFGKLRFYFFHRRQCAFQVLGKAVDDLCCPSGDTDGFVQVAEEFTASDAECRVPIPLIGIESTYFSFSNASTSRLRIGSLI